jgi:hypothetical protein
MTGPRGWIYTTSRDMTRIGREPLLGTAGRIDACPVICLTLHDQFYRPAV